MFKGIKRLSHKLTLSVILAVTFIFLLTSIYEYRSDNRETEEELLFKLDYTADMISASLADPVWDYDYKGIQAFGDSVFADPEIALLVVLDNVSGELYNHELLGDEYQREFLVFLNHPIKYEDETIGNLTLGMTKFYYLKKIREHMTLRLIELMVSVVTLTVIIYFISYQVTRPLSILEMDAKALAEGRERIKVSDYREDEIGHLASSFNEMGDIIEKTTKELHEMNSLLEEKVANRTEELLEKNSELNVALKTLKSTQTELIRSSKLKLTTRLVAGVAHEINTPLGLTITITTFIDEKVKQINALMDRDDLSDEDLRKLTHDIKEAALSLETNLSRVTKLMDHFKQLMLENQQQTMITFDICQHLHKIVGGIKMDLMGQPIDISVACEGPNMITSYPNAFMQIIQQLADNSIQHGFEDVEHGKIDITCNNEDKKLFIKVEDNGNGMSAEMAEQIFNPFFKGGSKVNGNGLGLAIVDNIVNVHLGGHIHCKSGLNQGTAFEIEVPLDK